MKKYQILQQVAIKLLTDINLDVEDDDPIYYQHLIDKIESCGCYEDLTSLFEDQGLEDVWDSILDMYFTD